MVDMDSLLYQFDISGFVRIEGALDDARVDRLARFWSDHLLGRCVHDVDFKWSADWVYLIDPETVFPLLDKLFSSRFRLDHMFCADERFVSSGGLLHHQADMFQDGIFYYVSNRQIFNGLTCVLYALSNMQEYVNHFCCIPGSHRGNFSVPDSFRHPETNPMLHHVYLRAGDALVFSEGLVHGTYQVESTQVRKAVFARYTNAYSYYRKPLEHDRITALPPTPNYSSLEPAAIDPGRLTERQRQLVVEPAYARGRKAIASLQSVSSTR